jgi:hypothetical protein
MLRAVLTSERNVDALIEQAWSERDDLRRQIVAAEVRLQSHAAVREIVEVVASNKTKRSRSTKRADKEAADNDDR